MKITDDDLKLIGELAAKITPLPWVEFVDFPESVYAGEIRSANNMAEIARMPDRDDRPDDFRYLAFAANICPHFSESLRHARDNARELRRQRDTLIAAFQKISRWCDGEDQPGQIVYEIERIVSETRSRVLFREHPADTQAYKDLADSGGIVDAP